MRKDINLILGFILLAITAYFGLKILMPFPLILLGLVAGQYHLFENISLHRNKIMFVTIVMGFISMASWFYQWQYVPEPLVNIQHLPKDQLAAHITNIEQFSLIGLQFSPFASAFTWEQSSYYYKALCSRLLAPLKAYGRMALTNYLGQTALILLIGHAFGLIGQLRYLESFVDLSRHLWLPLLLSKLWLYFFRFGPMEWLWRIGTY